MACLATRPRTMTVWPLGSTGIAADVSGKDARPPQERDRLSASWDQGGASAPAGTNADPRAADESRPVMWRGDDARRRLVALRSTWVTQRRGMYRKGHHG